MKSEVFWTMLHDQFNDHLESKESQRQLTYNVRNRAAYLSRRELREKKKQGLA